MNIAFFTGIFPAISETFIVNQIIALKRCGHTVHIYATDRFKGDKIHSSVIDNGLLNAAFYLSEIPQARSAKIFLLVRQIIKNLSGKNVLKIFNAVFKNDSKLSVYDLIHYLGKPEYDVLHAHFGVNGNYVAELKKLGLYKSAQFITTFHGYDLDNQYTKSNFYSLLFQFCRLFTVNSLYSKNLLMKLGCTGEIIVLPVGLDINKFKPGSIKSNKGASIRILFVGRLIEFKAPDRVVDICRILKTNNRIKFSAIIVGDGPMLPLLQSLISENELTSNVKIEGSKTQEEIIKMMELSDIFLYPGITFNKRGENQGLVLQEAQAMQLPVLISDAGGMQEGVTDGVTGFVLPENDILGFVRNIELLASDSLLRKKMGEAGRQMVTEKYNIDLLNIQLLKLYQK